MELEGENQCWGNRYVHEWLAGICPHPSKLCNCLIKSSLRSPPRTGSRSLGASEASMDEGRLLAGEGGTTLCPWTAHRNTFYEISFAKTTETPCKTTVHTVEAKHRSNEQCE